RPGHVRGPLASREVRRLPEGHEPVDLVVLQDDEVRLGLLPDPKPVVHLARLASGHPLLLPPCGDDNCRSDLHDDVVALARHLVPADPDVLEGQTLPGGNVELQPVPGADDNFAVVHPFRLPVGFLARLQRAGQDVRLAHRPRHVRTDIGQSVQVPLDVEDTELSAVDIHHSMAVVREVLRAANPVALPPVLGGWEGRRLEKRTGATANEGVLRLDRLLRLLDRTTHLRILSEARAAQSLRPVRSMLRKRNAFSPMTFRRTSSEKGTCANFIGWSKSWCGQSEANIVVFSPS